MIDTVNFEDGAKVNAGDLLFTLDSRQIDAQIAQAEGVVTKDQAQVAGAQRDLTRYSDLIGKGATPQTNVDNARTAVDILRGTIQADQAMLENLKVQKSYTVIRAPISGRISAATVKVGNFVRPSDTEPIATINQMAPVYVVFAMPQRVLIDLRDGMAAGDPRSSPPCRAISGPRRARSRWSRTRSMPRPAWSRCAASWTIQPRRCGRASSCRPS